MSEQNSASGGSDGAPVVAVRVLLVDDAAENRLLLGTMLARSGCALDVVGSGEEALSRVLQQTFDVVLMDMELPGISGFEATQRIRAAEQGRRTRIVAVTGHSSDDAVRRCRDAGCDDHLAKPFTQRSLIAAIAGDDPTLLALLAPPPADSVTTLLPGYLRSRRKDVERLRESLAAGRFRDVAFIGHRMAGSAAAFGFPEIGDIGAALEAAGRDADAAAAAAHVDALAAVLARV